jgi:A/G-specific adenine glycosylase
MNNDFPLEEGVAYAAKLLADLPEFLTDLPWRSNRSPYRVFIAEFLLVRTRTDVVATRFEKIIDLLPNLETIASSEISNLELILKDLGLKKRAALLQKAAEYIRANHDGEIPKTVEELSKIPGIGIYTSAAITSFAYGQSTVPADVNILRFISRLTGLEMVHKTKGSPKIRYLLPNLSKENGGLDAEKLLDFTRLICKPRRPACDSCPLILFCNFGKNRV